MTTGFMSHLILDEIWSIDFRHMKLKSSWGTGAEILGPLLVVDRPDVCDHDRHDAAGA